MTDHEAAAHVEGSFEPVASRCGCGGRSGEAPITSTGAIITVLVIGASTLLPTPATEFSLAGVGRAHHTHSAV
jgi:hypothetical protein